MRYRPIIDIRILIPVILVLLVILLIHIFRRNEKLRTNILSAIRIIIICALAFMVLMRPSKEEKTHDVYLSNLDVMFVVDDTISMWAEDMNGGTRMKEAEKDVKYIMDELAGANFALIKFDNYSQILSPYTQDSDDVKDYLDTISVMVSLDAKGSSMNTPYTDMESLLHSTAKKKDRQAIVFFLSDGEITNDEKLSSYAGLKDYVKDGAVLGYGTSEGGLMKDGYGHYIYDPEGFGKAKSKIDEKNLKQIASDLGLTYIHVEDQHSVDTRLSIIKSMAKSVANKQKLTYYTDYYFYFALPLLIMLILEFSVVAVKKRL